MLTPDVPGGSSASPVGRYREPSILPDGRILVSWADGPVNDMNEQSLTAPDFGIYIYDTKTGQNQLVYNDRATWDLNALAVVPRATPHFIGAAQNVQDATLPVRIGSVNVSETSLNEVVSGAQFNNTPLHTALQQGAVAVRVIEGFSSEAAKGVTMFGLTMFEGAAVLGEAPVFADGSWLANVPAYLPMHLQPIDKFGLAIRNQQLWIQGMPNDDRRCVGCHESRTAPGTRRAPARARSPSSTRAVNFTEPIASRTEYPWDKKVQPLLDPKCVSCHNGSTTDYYYMTSHRPGDGPADDLQDPDARPVGHAGDRLLRPQRRHVARLVRVDLLSGDSRDGRHDGHGQDHRHRPSDVGRAGQRSRVGAHAEAEPARGRRHLGVAGRDQRAPPRGPGQPVRALTAAERQTIAVYPMDLGGQYCSRQNTGFVPFTSGDAVTPVTAAH